MTGTETTNRHYYSSSLALLGGLGVRTGMPAHPSWCKSQKTKEETKHTSGNHLRRNFFGIDAVDNMQPGYLAGRNNVQEEQAQPNHMIGFLRFDIDPATAGSFRVLEQNYFYKNPASCRVFCCTNNL